MFSLVDFYATKRRKAQNAVLTTVEMILLYLRTMSLSDACFMKRWPCCLGNKISRFREGLDRCLSTEREEGKGENIAAIALG